MIVFSRSLILFIPTLVYHSFGPMLLACIPCLRRINCIFNLFSLKIELVELVPLTNVAVKRVVTE